MKREGICRQDYIYYRTGSTLCPCLQFHYPFDSFFFFFWVGNIIFMYKLLGCEDLDLILYHGKRGGEEPSSPGYPKLLSV